MKRSQNWTERFFEISNIRDLMICFCVLGSVGGI